MTKMQLLPETFARTIAEAHSAAGVVDHRRSRLWLGAKLLHAPRFWARSCGAWKSSCCIGLVTASVP